VRQCLICQTAFQVIIALQETWLKCLWKVRDLSRVTPRSFTVLDRGIVDPAILMWEILDKVLLR